MNLIENIVQNTASYISNIANTKPVPDLIDSVSYDLYENNNPFRKNSHKTDIENENLRFVLNTSTQVGAEVFSVFTNPYYLSHKITHIPVYYKNAVDLYNKNS